MNKPLDTPPAPAPAERGAGRVAARVRRADRRRQAPCATAPASRSSRSTRRTTGTATRYDDRRRLSRASRPTRAASTPTMHRGRTWTQRQLIGLGTPADYNARLRDILAQGATAVSLIPCNSVFRGYDMDEVARGAARHLRRRRQHRRAHGRAASTASTSATISCAMNDPSPFTLLAFMLATAKRRGVDWRAISGTSNQSDYLSHFVANHMFFRIALPGARRDPRRPHRLLQPSTCRAGTRCRWSASTCSRPARRRPRRWRSRCRRAIQYADDCVARGMDPDAFLPRFTFFFDISCRFFEEIAQVPRRPPHLGAARARALRRARIRAPGASSSTARPRASTSRASSRSTTSRASRCRRWPASSAACSRCTPTPTTRRCRCPTEFGARIAVATQNILREEAHLTDVIDPLGG